MIDGSKYADDYGDDVDVGEQYSEDSIDSDEESYESELSAGSEFTEDEEDEISSKPFEEEQVEAGALNEKNAWQSVRIAFRKSYTIKGKESDGSGDGSTISFRLSEDHPVAPWEKLGDNYDINSESILGNVRLVEANSTLPAAFAYTASMIDPLDGTERVTPNMALPYHENAVSGIIKSGEPLKSTDTPNTLVEAPEEIKATFLSTLDQQWTEKEMKAGLREELGRDEVVRVQKSHPVLLSYLLGIQRTLEANGRRYDAMDHVEPSGKDHFLIPKEQAWKKHHEIMADSKKNITANFFYKNFQMNFSRAWTDGHKDMACASTIGDKTELFDNVSEAAVKKMKDQTHSISFVIEADFYTGKLGK